MAGRRHCPLTHHHHSEPMTSSGRPPCVLHAALVFFGAPTAPGGWLFCWKDRKGVCSFSVGCGSKKNEKNEMEKKKKKKKGAPSFCLSEI